MAQTPAAEAFAAAGIPESDWTDAMRLAVKQKWAGLPVGLSVAELRTAVAGVTKRAVPSVEECMADLAAQGKSPVTQADGEAEHARLSRNAAVNAWRERNRFQAALDCREAKFAALRAKRGSKVAEPSSVSGDVAPAAVA